MIKKNYFLLLDQKNKRVRLGDKLSPVFENAKQAENFIDIHLGGSPYVKIVPTNKIMKDITSVNDMIKEYGNQQLSSWQNNLRNKRVM